jgi:hypothetical protein
MNDSKNPLPSSADPDAQMITVLRSCGFDVRVQHRAPPGARPEVYGTIDNALSLFKLSVAGADCIGEVEIQPAAVGERGWLNCPFCGSEHISMGEILSFRDAGETVTKSMCEGCGACGPGAVLGPDEVDYGDVKATAAWNSRTAPVPAASAQALKNTDLSKRLRESATGGKLAHTNVSNFLLHAAADEIERYYSGMMNWKATAEAKDAATVPQDIGRDAARLVKLLRTCTETKIKFNRDNQPRQITMIFKDSVETSKGYQAELRKTLDEFQPVEVAAPFKDAKGGAQ